MKYSRLETIKELSIVNNRPFKDVMELYGRFSFRVYYQAMNKGEIPKLYDPNYEQEVFDRVERYFKIDDIKRLRRLDNAIRRESN